MIVRRNVGGSSFSTILAPLGRSLAERRTGRRCWCSGHVSYLSRYPASARSLTRSAASLPFPVSLYRPAIDQTRNAFVATECRWRRLMMSRRVLHLLPSRRAATDTHNFYSSHKKMATNVANEKNPEKPLLN